MSPLTVGGPPATAAVILKKFSQNLSTVISLNYTSIGTSGQCSTSGPSRDIFTSFGAAPLGKLSVLILSHNRIDSLRIGQQRVVTQPQLNEQLVASLVVLKLDHNLLSRLDEFDVALLRKMRHLRLLDLSFNFITTIWAPAPLPSAVAIVATTTTTATATARGENASNQALLAFENL